MYKMIMYLKYRVLKVMMRTNLKAQFTKNLKEQSQDLQQYKYKEVLLLQWKRAKIPKFYNLKLGIQI